MADDPNAPQELHPAVRAQLERAIAVVFVELQQWFPHKPEDELGEMALEVVREGAAYVALRSFLPHPDHEFCAVKFYKLRDSLLHTPGFEQEQEYAVVEAPHDLKRMKNLPLNEVIDQLVVHAVIRDPLLRAMLYLAGVRLKFAFRGSEHPPPESPPAG